MEKLLSQTKKLIFHKQKDILSSAIILSVMIIVSRFFGLIRYRTLATYFTKEELDIFFAAFRIPDFVFEILITGALSSAFIPIFIKYQKKDNKDELQNNISSIINFIFLFLFIFVFITSIGAEFIVPLLTPGFSADQIDKVVEISRILLITQLPFLVAGNILSGIAQANRIFLITAIAPIIYNLGIIGGTILFSSQFSLYGPLIGTIIGASLFFLIQLPILYLQHFRFYFFKFERKVLHEFITLFVPRLLSVLTTQIDLTIDLILASLVGSGSYTIFFFSQHLSLFPVSFIGMAFGQASLPYMSNLFKNNQIMEMKKIFVNSLLQLLYLSVPASLFFIFARTPIVRIVFGGRKFDWLATNQTALTLSIFALSIPAHAIFYFITRSFYAMHDTKTPFTINFATVGLNIILSWIFIVTLGLPVWSLALSFSISITINIFLLLISFHKKIGGFDITKLTLHSIKIYLIAFLATLPSYAILKILDPLVINTTRTINVGLLLSIVFLAFGFSYLFFSWLFTVEEIYILSRLLIKIDELKRRLSEVYTESG